MQSSAVRDRSSTTLRGELMHVHVCGRLRERLDPPQRRRRLVHGSATQQHSRAPLAREVGLGSTSMCRLSGRRRAQGLMRVLQDPKPRNRNRHRMGILMLGSAEQHVAVIIGELRSLLRSELMY